MFIPLILSRSLPLKPPRRPRLSPFAASPTSRNVAIAALKLSSRNFPY